MSFLARPRQILIGLVCLLLICAAPIAHASNPLQFNGLTRTISLGSISLIQPYGIAVDPSGNLYIADQGNNRVVEVNPQGVASVLTINGLNTPLSTPRAVAIDGSGNLYIADSGNNRVVEVTPAGYYYGLNMGALSLNNPLAVAVDNSGNLFIADTGNNRIVEVPPSGGAATVLSITGLSSPSTLSFPDGLAVDTSGNLYIADFNNNRIVKVAAGGTTGTVLVSGSSYSYQPVGVAVDAIGNVYFSGVSDGGYISQVDTSGNPGIMNFSPTSPTGSTPKGIAVDVFGAVYVTDSFNSRILVVNPQMNPNITSGSSGYSANKTAVGFGHIQLGAATGTSLPLVFHISSTPMHSVKVLTQGTQSLDFTATGACPIDTVNSYCTVTVQFLPLGPGLRTGSVVLYDGSQNVMMSIPLYGFSDAPVAALAPNTATVINTGTLTTTQPFQIALDGAGNKYIGSLFGATYNASNVIYVPAGGGSASNVNAGSPGGSTLHGVSGIALDGAGNLFIADYYNSRIVVMTPGGVSSVLTINGAAVSLPMELAFDGAGNLYVSNYRASNVVVVSGLTVVGSTSSGYGRVLGTGSYTFSNFTFTGVAVGPNGTVYITSGTSNGGHVIQVTAAGAASQLTPTGITLIKPSGATVDGMGNLYVADQGNGNIVEITTAGVASVVSINNLPSPLNLGNPFGVTADSLGNLYLPDYGNARSVYVSVQGGALSFADTNAGSTSSDSPQTATVTNLGNQALTLSASPNYPADYVVNGGDTNPCTSATSLTAGTVCDVSVKFTPQSVGFLSETITVTDNALNGTSSKQNVAVTGTGLQPGDTTSTTVASNPTALSTGQPATITATIADTQSGHTSTVPTGTVTFTDTVGSTIISLNSGNPVTLSGGVATLSGVVLAGLGTHTIQANYAGVTGSFLTSNGSTPVVLTQATITAAAGPTIQPVAVGSTSPVLSATFQITGGNNVGSFTVLDTGISSQEFNSAAGSTCTTGLYLTNTTCTVNFTFSPAYPGARNGAIQVLDPSNNILSTVYISGTGTGPQAVVGFNGTGTVVAKFGQKVGNTQIQSFSGSLVDAVGNIYATDPNSISLFKFTRTGSGAYSGAVFTLSGVPISTSGGALRFLAIDGAGILYTDNVNSVVRIVNGVVSTVSLGSFTLSTIRGVNVDANGNLYISDSGFKRILVVPPNGGTPYIQPNLPSGDSPFAAMADANGTVYYSEFNSHSIKSITKSGTVSTLYTMPVNANIFALNFDANGNLLYGDGYNGGLHNISTSTGQSIFLPAADPCGVNAFQQAGNGDYIDSSIACGQVLVFQGNPATSTSLSFATTKTGSTSTDSPKTVKVYNVGNAALSISVPITGTNPALTSTSFTNSSTNACPQVGTSGPAGSLAAGSSCLLNISFVPVAVGSNTGSLVMTNNSLNAVGSTQTITLSGTGLPSVTGLAFATPPSTPINVGGNAGSAVTVNEINSSSAIVTTATDTITLTVIGPSSYTATYTARAVAGVATFNLAGVALATPGTYTYTATEATFSATAQETVTKITPGITLTSNSNPVLVQNSITLTATVSSSISTPTGTVSFVDGATPIGTGTVNSSGVATYSTAALAVGTHTITAVYSGDTNFLTITSGALTQGVQDFNLVISASSGTTGATSVTALPGGVAVFTFTLSPVGTTTFPTTVTLSASGLPAGATYTFSPATLAAGTGSTTVTLTIQLAQVSAVHMQPFMRHSAQHEVLAQNKPASKLPYLALAVLLLPFAGRMRRTGKKLSRLLPLLLLLIAGLAATAGLSGCTGLNSGYFGQAPMTYTITVTGTSGTLVHSTSVTLTVQ